MKKLFIIFLCLVSIHSLAQQDTLHRNRKTYFGGGFSLGGGNITGVYGDAFLYLQQKTYYLELKVSGIEEFDIFGSTPELIVSDFSLIMGKNITINKYHAFQFGVGLSIIKLQSRGASIPSTNGGNCFFCAREYEIITRKQFGIPLEIRYHLFLDNTASLNLGLSANINSLESFYGFSIGTTLGRLRDRTIKR